VPLQCLWRDSVTLISTLLLTYLLTLKFMIPITAATIGVPHASSPVRNSPWKFIVVTLCAFLTRHLFVKAKFLVLFVLDFCRVMLCKRGLRRHAVSVCLSVCPCVCPSCSWIVSKRINISSNFFHHRAATSSFPYQTSWQYSDDDPPPHNGGVECKGYEKMTIFY